MSARLWVGFAAERPDRIRYEFDAAGRLVDMVDGAGVGLRYVYELRGGYGVRLTAVYEPRSCAPASPVTLLSVVAAGCRSFRLAYSGAIKALPPSAEVVPGQTDVTDPAGRTTIYRTDANGDLISVTNPAMPSNDVGQALTFSYSCANVRVLCSAGDPRGRATTFSYTVSGGQHLVTAVLDRMQQVATGLAYDFAAGTAVVTRGTHAMWFSGIDGFGRVALVQEGEFVGGSQTVLRQMVTTWDNPTAPCREPDRLTDHRRCRVARDSLQTGAGATPDAETRFTYNAEGMVLVEARENGGVDPTTTRGWRAQVVTASSTTAFVDEVLGSNQVSVGARNGGLAPVLFVLSDPYQELPPRGNVSFSWRSYVSVHVTDANPVVRPNVSQPDTSICANSSGARRNTGLLCETDAPHTGEAGSAVTSRAYTRYLYDSFGQRTFMTTPLINAREPSRHYRYEYYPDSARDLSGTTSAGGWLKAVFDPHGSFVAFAYDAAGNVVRTWDRNATAGLASDAFPGTATVPPNDRYTANVYGVGATALAKPWRYLRDQRDQLGNLTSYDVDPNGNPTRARTPRGNPGGTRAASATAFDTTSQFDFNDRVSSRVDPAGRGAGAGGVDLAWRFVYDPFDNQTSVVDPNGHATLNDYDAVNRSVQTRWTRSADPVQRPAACPQQPPPPTPRWSSATSSVPPPRPTTVWTTRPGVSMATASPRPTAMTRCHARSSAGCRATPA